MSNEIPQVIGLFYRQHFAALEISQIADALNLSEKEARTAIDGARVQGFNIKNVGERLFQLQKVVGEQTKGEIV